MQLITMQLKKKILTIIIILHLVPLSVLLLSKLFYSNRTRVLSMQPMQDGLLACCIFLASVFGQEKTFSVTLFKTMVHGCALPIATSHNTVLHQGFILRGEIPDAALLS